jgi:ribosome modulation factor
MFCAMLLCSFFASNYRLIQYFIFLGESIWLAKIIFLCKSSNKINSETYGALDMARTRGSTNKPKFAEDGTPLNSAARLALSGDAKNISAKRQASVAPREPRVPGAEPAKLTDDQFRSLLMHSVGKVKPLLDTIASKTGELRTIYKVAKSEGIPKKDIDLVIQLQKQEESEVSAAAIRRAKIIEWVHPGALSTLNDVDIDAAFEAGLMAGREGSNGHPPYPQTSDAFASWMNGWRKGQAENGEGSDPLADAENYA